MTAIMFFDGNSHNIVLVMGVLPKEQHKNQQLLLTGPILNICYPFAICKQKRNRNKEHLFVNSLLLFSYFILFTIL